MRRLQANTNLINIITKLQNQRTTCQAIHTFNICSTSGFHFSGKVAKRYSRFECSQNMHMNNLGNITKCLFQFQSVLTIWEGITGCLPISLCVVRKSAKPNVFWKDHENTSRYCRHCLHNKTAWVPATSHPLCHGKSSYKSAADISNNLYKSSWIRKEVGRSSFPDWLMHRDTKSLLYSVRYEWRRCLIRHSLGVHLRRSAHSSHDGIIMSSRGLPTPSLKSYLYPNRSPSPRPWVHKMM